MAKRLTWILLSCLLVLVMVLAACKATTTEQGKGTTIVATATTPATPATPTTTLSPTTTLGKEMVKDSLGRLVEKPQYGGTLNNCVTVDPQDFDNCYKSGYYTFPQDLTYDKLVGAAWIKGPTGTNEISLYADIWPEQDANLEGRIAKSWELPDPLTIIWHLRSGVHFHNKPPTNGREVEAQDVVVSIQRLLSPTPGINWLAAMPVKPTQYLTPDKYTVVVKFDKFDASIFPKLNNTTYIIPRDAVATNPEALRNWKNECGTGPYILADYVAGNSITFKRNPDYWNHDPLHPENQLPYTDAINMLIVPDESTRISLLRVGKTDHLVPVKYQYVDSLKSSSPDLKFAQCLANAGSIRPRVDKPPFSDIKVRMALSMAINRDVMIKDLYGGQGDFIPQFLPPNLTEVYTPLEEYPKDVQEAMQYHPDKARQLLAEAGYPKGFQTELVCSNASPDPADLASFIQPYWHAVGVDFTIKLVDAATWTSITYGRKIETVGITAGGGMNTQQQAIQALDNSVRTPTTANYGCVSDAYFDKTFSDCCATYDMGQRITKMKALGVYLRSQFYTIELPAPRVYSVWQPWLKNFTGEAKMELYRYWGFYAYAWIDQDMRQAKTGRR